MSEGYWRHIPLKDIDPTSQVNLLPLTGMYMGAKIACLLASLEYQQVQRALDVRYFLNKVQEFYIEAWQQFKLKKGFLLVILYWKCLKF